jgi:hypothetical protein
MKKIPLLKRSLVTLVILISGLLFANAQTSLTNNVPSASLTYGGGANTSITFKVTNGNALPISISSVIYPSFFTNPNGMSHTLWHSTTDLTGTPNISLGTGWVIDANVTNFTAIGGYQPLFTGLNIIIPPGATYRFAVNGTTGVAATPGLVYGVAASVPTSVTSADNVLLETGINGAGVRVNMPNALLAQRNYAGGITYSIVTPNDLTITNIYAQGQTSNGYTASPDIRARVLNVGTGATAVNTATLTITGANPYSTTATIPALGVGQSAVISFTGYTTSAIGTSTIQVTLPADDILGNNTLSVTQDATKDLNSYKYATPPITLGVGFTGASGDFVARFVSANNFGNADTLNGFEVVFTTTGQPYQVGIWSDAGGVPGTNLYTSGTQLSATGSVFVSLPDVEVSGTYYVGIRQTGTVNVGFGYQIETPVRSGDFFFTSPTGNSVWTDFNSASANFRISATVQYKTPVPPNCAVYLAPLNLSSVCPNGVTLNYGSGGGGPTGYRVYLGTNQALVEAEDPSTLVQNSAATSYATGVLNNNATYYWRVTAYNGLGDATSCVASQSFNTSLVSCYCASTATNSTFEHVTNVQSGAFSNPSLSTLYTNYTGLGAINNVNINSTFNITVTLNAANIFDEDRIYIFADFNQDGDWNDAGELCGNADVTIAGGNVYVVSCTVPANALPGNTLLRIKFGDEVSTTAMNNDPCQASFTFGEVEDYLLNITCGAQASATNPACENSALNLTATYLGSGTPVSYSWTTTAANGFTSTSATPQVTASANPLNDAGDYTVVITDNNGCTSSATVSVVISSAPIASVSSNSPVCEGGDIQLNATGGDFYSWTGPGILVPNGNVSNPSVNGATIADGGNYTVTVTDLFGCSVQLTENVSVNPNPSLNIVSQTDVGCSGGSDGSFTVLASGGAGAPYSYDENGNQNFDGIYTNYAEGTYTVIASDFNTCSASVNVVIGATSVAPPANSVTITSFPTVACAGNNSAFTTNAVIGATGYNWSVPAGTLINGQPGPFVTLVPNATITFGAVPANGSGWLICVTAFNGCGQTNTNCKFVRGALSAPGAIAGSVVACENSSSAYSIAPVAAAAGYNWTGTNGITFTGSGTSVTANFPNGFVSGSICVAGTLACGYTGPQRCITVTNAVPALGAIDPASSFTVCPGQNNAVYSIPNVTGAASYTWTLPANMSFVSGAGTNSIVASVGPGFNVGTICVTATSVCGVVSPPRCRSVVTSTPPTPGNISGDATGVCGQTIVYSVPASAGITTFNWSVPAGATLVSPNGTNTVSVSFSNGFVSGQVCVTGTNNCGTGAARCINVKGTPAIAQAINGPATVCVNESGLAYSVPTVLGATNYNWTVPAGAIIISGQNTNSIIVDWGTSSGNVTVTTSNACGSSGTRVLNVVVNCRTSATHTSIGMNVYPNPASTNLIIDLNGMSDGAVAIEITDIAGRVINSFTGAILNNKFITDINVSSYSKGVYLLKASNSTGQQAATRFNVQ